ncbi:MAG: hypothetical protein HYS60_02410 [Candidatus Wildermuthbacteria bacterium]|nr:hypothetical protein [Candidatus Wildermuthbacteria bacterium]
MPEKKTLLIIDSNSLIHRAFHALPPLSTSKGEMVNAVYGFLLAFFKAAKEFRPEYVAACFDVPRPTKRHEKFKAYKAKREKAPNELYSQMPQVKDVLKSFHIPVFEKEGYEADDLIGTIAKHAHKKQAHPPLRVVVLSGDMDTLQLVDEHTSVYTMRKGIQDTVLYDTALVKERFSGLTPGQVIDYKGLRGDPSDNIPGVTGVGEKTAIDLLLKFRSVENLYKELEERTEKAKSLKPRVSELLKQYKDQAFLNKELATLDRDAPIDFHIKDLAWKDFSLEEAKTKLESFEFKTLVPKLQELVSKPASSRPLLFQEEGIASRIERLFGQGVFSKKIYELEKSLIPVIADMEKIGIKIDALYFKSLAKEVSGELKKLESRIFELGGVVFNINSPKQLSDVLFQNLSLGTKGIRKTRGGSLSTASPELEKLKSSHPVIAEILAYRELAKLLNTYLEPLPLLADSEGRIHAHFDQLGAATGRMSSSDPNLQNIPAQGTWGKRVRKGFVAQKGFQLVSFDYSQMELRIAAFLANEKKMEQVFLEKGDIHRMTAAEVFGVSPDKVTEQMRYEAKALNFGILYGMGARGFAQSSGVPFEEAQSFIENYFLRFPKIAEYIESTKEFARKHGYVETIFGRKRYVPDIDSATPQIRAQAERVAVNHPVQGTAADLMKMAMAAAHGKFQGKDCRMVLQIHDELLFEISDATIDQFIKPIANAMEVIPANEIPLFVQAKAGLNWAELTARL